MPSQVGSSPDFFVNCSLFKLSDSTMQTDIQLIPATPEDYSTIADIYNVYVRDGKQTMEEQVHTTEDIANWAKKFHDREGLFVLKKKDKTIGWGIIKRYSDRAGYRFTCETAVYLHSDHLGQGHGSYVKRELINICKDWNYHHLVAKIFAVNTGSIIYNEKLGYEVVGRQKEIGFKDGKWTDVVIMQLILK